MNEYPTYKGIAVPVWDLALPPSHTRERNNHHNEWSARRMGRLAVTQALRDLERHQYVMPLDQHAWLHQNYEPPELPTEEQAAREVIDAYEKGERFKIYNKRAHRYDYHDIPLATVDRFIAQYALYSVFSPPAA